MFSIHKNILLALMLVIISGNAWSQQFLDPPIEAILTAVRYIDNGAPEYALAVNYMIGRKDGTADPFNPNTIEDTYRSIFVFNISQIPSNAEIQSATLDASISGYQCSYCIAEFVGIYSSIDPTNAQQIWEEVGASGTVYLSIDYDQQVTNISSQSLKDDLSSTLGNSDFFKIGVLSASEGDNNTEAQAVFLTLHVTYTVTGETFQITVENSFQGGEVKVDGSNYPSGTTFPWEENTQHTLEAFNQDWPAPNNYYRVFQHWIEPGGSQNNNNPLTITVTQNGTYRAFFLKRFDFEVDNEFVDGGSGGTIKVNGQVKSAPDSITIIEGETVLVEAPTQTQTVNGKQITYNFLKWQDGGTSNPRSFVPNDHTNITASYKGHLVSLETDATASNNQRKMVWDDTFQKYHMVYEDNGDIYYTTTTGPDNAWTPEEIVAYDPDPNYQYAFPAISVSNGIVVIVWQERNSVFSNIYLRVKDAGGWHNSKVVANFALGLMGDPVATPVIVQGAESDFVFLIVWHDYVFNNLRIRAYKHSTDTFGAITDIPLTNSNSMYPSLAADPYTNHLVWEESGNIYCSWFDHGYIGGNEIYTWYVNKESVSTGTGYSDHVFPSVTTDYDRRPSVMWQAYSGPDLESQIILHRRREGSGRAESGWGSVTSFIGNDDYYKPSIMSFPGILPPSQELRAVWRRSDNSIWIGKYNGSSWSTLFPWLYGVDPNISANMSADEVAKMVFRSSGTSPYTLTTTSENLDWSSI